MTRDLQYGTVLYSSKRLVKRQRASDECAREVRGARARLSYFSERQRDFELVAETMRLRLRRLVDFSGEGILVDAAVVAVGIDIEHIGDELRAERLRAAEEAPDLPPELGDHYEVDDDLNAAQKRESAQVARHVVRCENHVWHVWQVGELQHERDARVRHDEEQVDDRHDDQHAGGLRLAVRCLNARDRRALPDRLHDAHADHDVRHDDDEQRHEVRDARVPDRSVRRPHDVLPLGERRAAALYARAAPREKQVRRPVDGDEDGHSEQHFPAEELLEPPGFERREHYEQPVQREERRAQHVERLERRLEEVAGRAGHVVQVEQPHVQHPRVSWPVMKH